MFERKHLLLAEADDGTQGGSPASSDAQSSFEMDEFGEDFPPGELDASITGERPSARPAVEEVPAKEVAPVAAKPAEASQEEKPTTAEVSQVEDFGEPVPAKAKADEPSDETKPKADEAKPAEASVEVVEAKPDLAPQKTPEELQAERAAYRTQLTDSLVSQFPISDDELASFSDGVAEPEVRKAAMSKLMARATVHAVELVMQGVAMSLPNLLTTVNRANEEHAKWRTSFFGEFPDLNDAKFGPTIDRVAQALAADPNKAQITPQQFMEELGVTASMLLKRPLPKKFLEKMAFEGVKEVPPRPAAPTAARAQGAAPAARTEEVLNEFSDL